MKMGEIRYDPEVGFIMQTPDGVREVTLRCTVKGVVEVEEVADDQGIRPLRMTQMTPLNRNDDFSAQRILSQMNLRRRDII